MSHYNPPPYILFPVLLVQVVLGSKSPRNVVSQLLWPFKNVLYIVEAYEHSATYSESCAFFVSKHHPLLSTYSVVLAV